MLESVNTNIDYFQFQRKETRLELHPDKQLFPAQPHLQYKLIISWNSSHSKRYGINNGLDLSRFHHFLISLDNLKPLDD